MKARDGAAGDGHEQQRHDRRRAGRHVLVEGRGHHGGVHQEDGGIQHQQTHEELQAVDVVTRLQQHPHRQQRSHGRVDEQQDDPPCIGGQAHHVLGQTQREDRAQIDEQIERHHTDQRHPEQVQLVAVDALADDEGHHQRAPDRQHRRRRLDHHLRDDHTEHGVDHQQQQEDHHHEQAAGAAIDHPPGNGADRQPPVAHTGPHRRHVMHASNEDGAAHHPDKGRQPAPDDRNGRPDDGRRPRHRGEVVPPEHVLVGRHIVDAVLHGMRGRLVVRVELEDLLRNEARIDKITGCHEGKAGDQQGDCAHGASFVSAVGAIGTGCLKTACVARPQGAHHDIVQFCQTFIPVCTGPPRGLHPAHAAAVTSGKTLCGIRHKSPADADVSQRGVGQGHSARKPGPFCQAFPSPSARACRHISSH